MSLYDTLTGINTITFTLVLTLFGLTFLPWLKLNKWLKVIVRIVTILTMGYFLLVGWRYLDYDPKVPHKGEQITFPEETFIQVCNLRKLYKNGIKYLDDREVMMKYDCEIINAEFFLRNFKDNKKVMTMGEVKLVDSEQVFAVVDSFKTKTIGFGASFGNSEVRQVVLRSNNQTYIVVLEDLKERMVK